MVPRNLVKQVRQGSSVAELPWVGNQQHDIAVAKLNRKVQFSEYVRPVCLPDFVPPVDANIYITGWGSTKQVRYKISEYYSFRLYFRDIILNNKKFRLDQVVQN